MVRLRLDGLSFPLVFEVVLVLLEEDGLDFVLWCSSGYWVSLAGEIELNISLRYAFLLLLPIR